MEVKMEMEIKNTGIFVFFFFNKNANIYVIGFMNISSVENKCSFSVVERKRMHEMTVDVTIYASLVVFVFAYF